MSDTSKGPSFMAQALILALAAIIARFLGFLYKLPLINMIGDEGMGIYGQGAAVYNFFYILSSAGLPAAISRMVSARTALKRRDSAHKVFIVSLRFALGVGFFSCLALFMGAGFFAGFINSPGAYYSVVALAPTVLITSVLSSYRGYFQGMGNSIPTALSQIFEQIFNAVFSIFLAYIFFKQGDIVLAAAGGNAGTGIGALFGLLVILWIYFLARKRIKRGVKRDGRAQEPEDGRKILLELVLTAFPIIAGTAIFSFTGMIDTVMVMRRIQDGGFSHADALGFSGMLSNKFNALTTLPVAISAAMATAVIPSVSASVALNQTKQLSEKVNLALRLSMIISVPAAFGMGVFAPNIYALIFPNSRGGSQLLSYGFVSIIFLALYQISTGLLQGMGQVRAPVLSALLGCLAKIPVNYILLGNPKINIMGAVIGTIVCYLVAAPVNIFFLCRYTRMKMDVSGVFLKPVFSSLIMSLAAYLCYYLIYFFWPRNLPALLISIAVGVITYVAAMVMTGGLSERELKAFPLGGKAIKIINYIYGRNRA